MASHQRSTAVERILDETRERAEDSERSVTIGDIVEQIGHRGFGPLIFLFALIEVSPIGAIPGAPTLLAIIIALFAVQLMLGQSDIWLPRTLKKRSVSADRARKAIGKMTPAGRWLDRHFGHRLEQLTGAGPARAAGVAILLLCLTVPPLEVVPWASSAPMIAIAFFGLALTVADGLLMLLGFLAAGAALVTGLVMVIGAGG